MVAYSEKAAFLHFVLGLTVVVEDIVDGLKTLALEDFEVELHQPYRWVVCLQDSNHLAAPSHNHFACAVQGAALLEPCHLLFVWTLYTLYPEVVEVIEKSLYVIEPQEEHRQKCLRKRHPAGW